MFTATVWLLTMALHIEVDPSRNTSSGRFHVTSPSRLLPGPERGAHEARHRRDVRECAAWVPPCARSGAELFTFFQRRVRHHFCVWVDDGFSFLFCRKDIMAAIDLFFVGE